MKDAQQPAGWQVEDHCPQCGAPCLMEETDRLFACPYCRTRLYLAVPDFFEYCLPARHDPPQGEVLQVPYWRFRGITFSLGPQGVRCGVVDTSLAALHHAFLRPSLGLKPQVFRLRFARPAAGVRFLRSDFSLEDALQRVQGQQDLVARITADGPVHEQAFVGETMSVIYLPHIIAGNSLFDLALNRPLPCDRAEELGKILAHEQREVGKVTFLSALCPGCGWDLEAERDSAILMCRNCDSAWEPIGCAFHRRPFRIVPGAQGALHLPFWRLRASFEGVPLQSVAELRRFANLPRTAKHGSEEQEIFWWIPAFKVRPDLFLRVAQRMTIFQPEETLEDHLDGVRLHPVTLQAAEAQEVLRFLIAQLGARQTSLPPGTGKIGIRTVDALLVFLPFAQTGSEVVHEKARLGIQRNTLQFGRHL